MTHLRRTLWCASFLVVTASLTSCFAPSVSTPAPSPDGYLFCFWNVENLFDDQLDHRINADKSYDDLFAKDPKALQTKLDHLSQALLKMNDGKGPDILAIAEVESERAAELLREALNRGLADDQLHYSQPLFR
jgi:hypothetical protein